MNINIIHETRQVWTCGGSIEFIPCSHVGHIFRDGEWKDEGRVVEIGNERGQIIVQSKLCEAGWIPPLSCCNLGFCVKHEITMGRTGMTNSRMQKNRAILFATTSRIRATRYLCQERLLIDSIVIFFVPQKPYQQRGSGFTVDM